MPQSWIAPQSNNLLETFGQAQQVKAQRAQNALYAAKAAELPYERERAEALNVANIGKAQAQTRSAEATATKTDAEFTLNMVEWLQRDSANEPAVIGAFQFAAGKYPQIAPVLAKLESTRGTPEFKATVDQFSMTAKDKATQLLNEQKITEQQKQSGIDNQFQQANLGVAQGRLGLAQAGLGERQRHNQVMENRPQAGFSMSYDAEGRPVMSYGVKSEETALGTARGQQRAKAEENLPKVEDLATATINQLDKLLKHPGYESSVGATVRPFASRVDGTKEADFVNRLDQLKGGAFLQAFEQLKGGGQITEVEGVKATQAINRMNTATSEAEFNAATADFKSVIVSSRDRARAAAAGRPEIPPPPNTAQPQGLEQMYDAKMGGGGPQGGADWHGATKSGAKYKVIP